jgi:CheY-like chemotaxis protein
MLANASDRSSRRVQIQAIAPYPDAGREEILALWIDDEPQLLTGIAKSLALDECRVEFAATGSAGIDAALQAPHDVILLDWKLPDMTGAKVLEALRGAGLRTPIIMVTGHGSEAVAFECGRFGADVYLKKPVRALDLLRLVRTRIVNSPAPTPEWGSKEFSLHATELLAQAIVDAIGLPRDPRKLADLARVPGMTESRLRQLCGVRNLKPRHLLIFARLLRAVVLVQRYGAEFTNVLNVAAVKTLNRLLAMARLSPNPSHNAVSVARFFEQQELIRDAALIHVVRQLLERRFNADR